MPDHLMGWIVTLGITLAAFGLRLWNLAYPNKLVFDETFYAKDAYSVLLYGYERGWPSGDWVNESVANGTPDIMLGTPGFAVHPPMGKLLIGLGEWMFGMNSFGWRIMAVVFGSLTILVTIRLARRLARSTLIGAIAGVLLTFDGMHFVMSRIALLDIFQAFFTVAAVACLVADRDWFRLKLADHLVRHDMPDLGGRFGPVVWWRPWLLASGVMFGCAIACKWGSLYVLAAFGLVTVAWDIGARHLAGASRSSLKALLIDAPIAFVYLVVVSLLVYLASWTKWFASDGGWDRQWGAEHPDSPLVKAIGAPLASLWQFHTAMWGWHTGDTIKAATHPYASHPWTWLLMIRPVGVDAVNDIPDGTDGCVAPGGTCLQVITAMGTPLLWWMAAIAFFAGIFFWIWRRDWRFAVPVLGTAAVWLPWFQYADRPIFSFYSVVFLPFTVIGLALAFGKILGPAGGRHRQRGAIIVGTLMGLIIINFAFIYPILTDAMISRTHWLYRMWFGTWI